MTDLVEEIRKAEADELPQLLRFYKTVCDAQALSPYSPSWHFGIYPAEEDLLDHLKAGEFTLLLREGRIAAAGVLAAGEDPIYADAAWPTACPSDEVCVLHLFAVHPDFRGQGLSGRLLEALAAQAGTEGKTVLRLDVLTGNLPAERLYLRHGFYFAEEREVFYPDTGNIRVRLFERVL